MPRRAAADFSVMLPGQPVARLRPPPDLTPDARETFLTIVGSVPAAKFQPSDVYLLAAYVRAVELEREASQRLREEGTVVNGAHGPKASPWLTVLGQAVKTMSMLSHRLRLSPQGRSPTLPTRPAPTLSAYERLGLLDDDDDTEAAEPS
jgi:P27 family predicted phage terminase small subunit